MKRFAYLCGGLAVLVAAQSATAQVATTNAGLAVWYDVRGVINDITVSPAAPFTRGQSLLLVTGKNSFVPDVSAGNAGGPGDAQVLRISPRLPVSSVTGLGGHVTRLGKNTLVDDSVKNIYAYITVEANGAGADQVISALGRDTSVVKQGAAGAGNKIESILVTPDTAQWSIGGTNASAVAVGDDFALTAKSVKIPVAVGPVYDASGGAIPTGVFRVACITVTASTWNRVSAAPGNSTFAGHDSVNNLLMTRAISSGAAGVEVPDFGYTTVDIGDNDADGRNEFVTGSNGGIPEANSGGDGSTIGTTSVESDFDIVVQAKGDFNNSGNVSPADIPAFQAAILTNLGGTIRQRGVWLGDFNNTDTVTPADIPGFQAAIVLSLGDCTTNPAVDCLPCVTCAPPTCPAP